MTQLNRYLVKLVLCFLLVQNAQKTFSYSIDTSSIKPIKPEYVIIIGDGFDGDTVTFVINTTCIFTKEILTSNKLNGKTQAEVEIYNIAGKYFVNYDKKIIPINIDTGGFEVSVCLTKRMQKYKILKKNGTFVLISNTFYLNKFDFYQFSNYPELD